MLLVAGPSQRGKMATLHWALFSSAVLIASAVVGCGAGSETDPIGGSPGAGGAGGAGAAGGSAGFFAGGSGPGGSTGGGNCQAPPTPAGAEATLAPEYAAHYTAYELGPVPGVPEPLGGCTVHFSDPSTLLIAGASELPSGAIYSIGVEREPCGHIVGFVGTATQVAATPYVDANLVYDANDLLFYTGWPVFELSQLLPSAASPAVTTDLVALGVDAIGDQGPGGVGLVPSPLGGAGELRIVTWPAGRWYHVDISPNGNLYDVNAATLTTTIPNNPGGFAYVPAGSPGFPNQSLIVAEWRVSSPADDKVATYEVDAQGDPLPATRKEFFTTFPRPWGAYFEPVTGDYLFLTWGESGPDRVYIVQGFAPPPPPPPPPE
jgi:hypothetical protein